jgi:GTP cyclohydrolase IA
MNNEKEGSAKYHIKKMIEIIGEDPEREGLKKTPYRIFKSWQELYSGYGQDPVGLLTTFSTEGYSQIVLLKNIELYSMCEHHMLPFFGKAHVAYIPDGRVIGISKLARLVDIFAKRMQIQERIGEQVTDSLMQYLKPLGAACVIEATHMCMRMRGVAKQNSVMITSSMKGVFLTEEPTREELMKLIKS